MKIGRFKFPFYLLVIFFYTSFYAPVSTADLKSGNDFDLIINKRRTFLTGGKKLNSKDPDIQKKIISIASQGAKQWQSLEKVLWRSFLWKDISDVGNSDFIIENYSRLRTMALAYSTHRSNTYRNKKLRDDIIFALDWLNKNQYNEKTKNTGSGRHYEITIPLILNDILVLMYEDLSKSQRDKYCKSILSFHSNLGETKGADLASKSFILAVSGAIIESWQYIDSAVIGLQKSLEFVKDGDGFYEDGSFIGNDKHPYSGGFAIDYLTRVVDLLYVLDGTAWENKVQKENVKEWLIHTFDPIVYKSELLDMVRGTEISIPSSGEKRLAELIASGLILSELSNDNQIESIVNQWVKYGDLNELFNNCSIQIVQLLKPMINDKTLAQDITTTKNQIKIYSNMDRVLVRSQNYLIGISMFSERIKNYESTNGMNLKGWYTSYGMTYLYNSTNDASIFWPTIDPYRLPGTTISKINKALAGSQSQTNEMKWVGGAQLDGQFGVVGMELEDLGTTLKAKKSWFLFDNEIVALGTNIVCNENVGVETILENRKIDLSRTELTINGTASPLEELSEKVSGIEWMHLKSLNDTVGTGYFFPKYYDLNLKFEKRRGKWTDINRNITDTTSFVHDYFTAWFDHGIKPTSGNYQYVIVPSITPENMEKYDQHPDIVILENNGQVQAAKDSKLSLIAANFWTKQKTTLSVDGSFLIICDQPIALFYQEKDDEIEIALSDPTQQNSGIVNLELINTNISKLTQAYNGLLVSNVEEGVVKLSIDLSNSKGRSLSFKFKPTEKEEKE